MPPTTLEIIFRLGIALSLGAVIGLERQWHKRTAGIRTNTLVCIGAAGFVIFASFFPHDNSPTRIAAQIVSGIGFLGAGVIMREGLTVRGLNSAATIWCSSTVGVFSGGGFLVEACILTGAIMTTNLLLRQFVQNVGIKFLGNEPKGRPTYVLAVSCYLDHQMYIREEIKKKIIDKKFSIKTFDSLADPETNTFKFTLTIVSDRKEDHFFNDLVAGLTFSSEVISAEWSNIYQENDNDIPD